VSKAEGAQELSRDTVALMEFQNASKSTGVAYFLWFFLGGLGVHRFYLRKTGTGALVLLCTLIGIFTLFPLIATGLILIYDLFTLPSQVRAFNAAVMQKIQFGKAL
jgi:TM2 domain-containing membrane protein YozV